MKTSEADPDKAGARSLPSRALTVLRRASLSIALYLGVILAVLFIHDLLALFL